MKVFEAVIVGEDEKEVTVRATGDSSFDAMTKKEIIDKCKGKKIVSFVEIKMKTFEFILESKRGGTRSEIVKAADKKQAIEKIRDKTFLTSEIIVQCSELLNAHKEDSTS